MKFDSCLIFWVLSIIMMTSLVIWLFKRRKDLNPFSVYIFAGGSFVAALSTFAFAFAVADAGAGGADAFVVVALFASASALFVLVLPFAPSGPLVSYDKSLRIFWRVTGLYYLSMVASLVLFVLS